jgi:hypothetical protein
MFLRQKIGKHSKLENHQKSSIVDPDPDLPGSAFIWLHWIRVGLRIRIQEPGNWPTFTNKPGILPFRKAFVPS